jgi:hypothetical protein
MVVVTHRNAGTMRQPASSKECRPPAQRVGKTVRRTIRQIWRDHTCVQLRLHHLGFPIIMIMTSNPAPSEPSAPRQTQDVGDWTAKISVKTGPFTPDARSQYVGSGASAALCRSRGLWTLSHRLPLPAPRAAWRVLERFYTALRARLDRNPLVSRA